MTDEEIYEKYGIFGWPEETDKDSDTIPDWEVFDCDLFPIGEDAVLCARFCY